MTILPNQARKCRVFAFIKYLILPFFLFHSNAEIIDLDKQQFTYYTIYDGLPQNSARCMVEDKYGVLWICTSAGLVRYDGYEFEVIMSDTYGNRLNSHLIRDLILEDDTLYIGTIKGLYSLELSNGKITYIQVGESPSIYVNKLMKYDNYILIGTKEGLYKKEKNIVTRLLRGHSIRDFEFNGEDLIISSINQGVFIGNFNDSGLRLHRKIENITSNYVLDIKATEEHLMFATYGQGLFVTDLNYESILSLRSCKEPSCQKSDYLSTVSFIDGFYYVGTREGLLVLDKNLNVVTNIRTSDYILNSTVTDAVQFVRSYGNYYWIGLRPGGLVKVRKKTNGLALYKNKKTKGHDDMIYTIIKFRNQIYAGSHAGLLILKSDIDSLNKVSIPGVNEINRINSMCNFNDEYIVIATSTGVFTLEPHSNQLIRLDTIDQNTPSLQVRCEEDTVSYFQRDSLFIHNNDITNVYKFNEISNSQVSVLTYYIKDSQILLGTSNGLYIYELDGENLNYIHTLHPESMVNKIVHDGDYILTTNNVIKLREGAINYDIPDEYSNLVFYSAEVINNNMWITTNDGILFLKPNGEYTQFRQSHGIGDKEFNTRSTFYDTETNKLYAGGLSNLTVISLSQFLDNNLLNENIVSRTQISNSIGEVYRDSFSHLSEIAVNEGDSLHIELGHLDSINRNNANFYYLLEDIFGESSVKLAPKERRISFVDISRNDFVVKFPFSDTSIDINVTPHPWNSTWAYIIYSIILLIIIFQIIRHYRTVQLTIHNEQMAKLEVSSKRKQLASLSHELRTPINSIIGILDTTENLSEDTNHVLSSAYLLRSLIDNILNNASIEVGHDLIIKTDEIILGDIIDECIHIMSPYFNNSGIKCLYIKKDVDFKCISVDKTKLQQVILNLLKNAIKHSQTATQVSIHTAVTNNILSINISDNGIGISEGAETRIFDIFHKDENQSSGFGLGLHISQVIARKMHGDLVLDMSYKKGARFIITIPFLEVESTNVQNIEAKKNTSNKPLKTLILEDDPLNIYALRLMLDKVQHKNYTFVQTIDEFWAEYNEDYEVLLMDLNFNDEINGIQLAKEISRTNQQQMKYILSAEASIEIIESAKFYVDDYLIKPVSMETLSRVLFNDS